MRLPSFVSAASAVALASLVVADSDAEKPSDVLSVTQDTFDSTVNPEALILVEFFAPWYVGYLSGVSPSPDLTNNRRCGHCKALAPHYEEAATTLKENNIRLAKVDCVDQADLCQSYGVQSYP